MEHFKFGCYLGLMTFCYVALGLFLGSVSFLFLGHTWVYNTMRLTPTHFLVVGGIIWGGIGFWIGWKEGSKRYLATGTNQVR